MCLKFKPRERAFKQFKIPVLNVLTEDDRMERWIVDTHNSLERTKSCLEMYFTLKNVVPEFLTDRDPAATWFQNATSTL